MKNRKDYGKMSDWINAGVARGLSDDIIRFHTKKLEDYERLRKSGLPILRDISLPYSEFSESNIALMEYLRINSPVCLRAIGNTPELGRISDDTIKNFSEAKAFLERIIKDEHRDDYELLITEMSDNKYSGVVISTAKELLIELGEPNLFNFSHGSNPFLSLKVDFTKLGHVTDKHVWRVEGTQEHQDYAFQALKHLTVIPDSFNPGYMRGYFEFVVSARKEIKFLDYKVNEMYLKL